MVTADQLLLLIIDHILSLDEPSCLYVVIQSSDGVSEACILNIPRYGKKNVWS